MHKSKHKIKYVAQEINSLRCLGQIPGTSLRHLLYTQFCMVMNTCSQSQLHNKNLTHHAILWIMDTNFSKEMMNNLHEK